MKGGTGNLWKKISLKKGMVTKFWPWCVSSVGKTPMYRYLLDTEVNSLHEKGGPTMMFQGVNYIRSVKKSKDVKKTDWLSDKEVYAFEIAAEFLQGKKNQPTPTVWERSMRPWDRRSSPCLSGNLLLFSQSSGRATQSSERGVLIQSFRWSELAPSYRRSIAKPDPSLISTVSSARAWTGSQFTENRV